MAGKSVLVVVVGVISAFSVGAGSYLAFRANRVAPEVAVSATPALSALETPAPSPAPTVDESELRPATSVRRPATPAQERPRRETVAPGPAPGTAPLAAVQPPITPTMPPPLPVNELPPPVTTPIVTAVEPPPPVVDAPKPQLEEVTVEEGSVIGIRIDQALSSETARVEDRVTARITRDVVVDGRTALPAGTRLEGVVTLVEPGGKLRARARLGLRFDSLIMANSLRVPIKTETILREGESPTGEAGSKIGASAVAGAILGAVIGGKRGAVIGSTAGAAGGTAVVMAGDRNAVVLTNGTPLTLRLTAPVTVTIEKSASLPSLDSAR